MVKTDALLNYLNGFFDVEKTKDYCPNGLQVEGKGEINKVITSVSASKELFKRAIEEDADLIIVHHGILWKNSSLVIRGSHKQRIKALLDSNINLFAYHLPLDLNSKIGNNILATKGLGLTEIRPFGEFNGQKIGFCGIFEHKIDSDDFFKKVNKFYNTKSLIFPFGPKEIKSVGIISGGAQNEFNEAIKEGLDVYITGEVSEPIMHIALEEKTHFISAGHYATERLGIQALGEDISKNFDLSVKYIDIPVPV